MTPARDRERQSVDTLSQQYATEFSIPLELASIVAHRFPNYGDAKSFLFPDVTDLHNPNSIPDIEAAAIVIEDALRKKEGILVYCHDDPDGYTSGVLMFNTLRDIARTAEQPIFIYPINREKDGYILNPVVLSDFRKKGVELLVTCDFGISSEDNFRIAREQGLHLVVCDHHEVRDVHFDAPAVNPKRPDSKYPFRDLAGVGVALKLAQVLYQRAFKLSPAELYGLKKDFFVLALVGTISDRVALCGENRILCRLGLSVIDKVKMPWLRCIKGEQEAGLSTVITTIIPTLASAAYCDSFLGIKMMTCNDPKVVADVIKELQAVTSERRQGVNELYQEALAAAKVYPQIVVSVIPFSKQHYLGSIAARMRDRYRRTSVVIGLKDERCHGELRSTGIDLYDMLASLREFFLDFGGHRKAAGFTMAGCYLDVFLDRIVPQVGNANVTSDAIDGLAAEPEFFLNREAVSFLQPLLPFGEGNAPPLLTDGVSVYTIDNTLRIIERG